MAGGNVPAVIPGPPEDLPGEYPGGFLHPTSTLGVVQNQPTGRWHGVPGSLMWRMAALFQPDEGTSAMDTGIRGFPRGDLRVSDGERDQAVAELSEHFQAGRLTQDEFDDRSGRALQARTGGDLDGLFTDLPPRHAVTRRRRRSLRRTRGSSRRPAAAELPAAGARHHRLHRGGDHRRRAVRRPRLLPPLAASAGWSRSSSSGWSCSGWPAAAVLNGQAGRRRSAGRLPDLSRPGTR